MVIVEKSRKIIYYNSVCNFVNTSNEGVDVMSYKPQYEKTARQKNKEKYAAKFSGKGKNKSKKQYEEDNYEYEQEFAVAKAEQEDNINIPTKDSKVRKLLLNLSALGRFDINEYYYEDEFRCNGIISVEPISKFLIWNMAKLGKVFDEIIIIASDLARNQVAGEGPWAGYTAEEVYINRIKKYMGVENYIEFFDDEQQFPVYEGADTELIKSVYGEKNPIFTVVPFEKGEEVNELIELKEAITKDADELELYIDTQGGNRNWIFQLDAILGMIKSEKVTICGRYAIDFFSGNRNDPHPIYDVEEFYAIHELLYAFNLFKKYGIGNDLFDYFCVSEDSDVRMFAGCLKSAMQAISICNIAKFVEELNKVKTYENNIKNISTESKFNLIIKEIVEDFIDITEAKNEWSRFIAIVRWCKEKQMMVQALNIVESNLINAIVKHNMKRDDNKKLMILIKNPAYYENKEFVNKEIYESSLTEDEYLYRQLMFQIGKEIENKNFNEIEHTSRKQMIDYCTCFNFDEINLCGHKSGSISINGNSDLISYTIPKEYAEDFCVLAYLYKYIKLNRNNIDHVNTNFIVKDHKELEYAIDFLLAEFEGLTTR